MIKLLLLYGGKSGEHEVSLRSAASILANLDNNKYHVIPVAMDKEGCFHVHEYQDLMACKEALPVVTEKSKSLPSILNNGRLALDAEVIFPIAHGPLYEDGALQGLLQLLDVAYVGSDILPSALGMDKDVARRLVCLGDISCARYKNLSAHSNPEQKKEFYKSVVEDFGWPLFVKPCHLGSSVGVSKVKSMAEMITAIDKAFRFSETIMVEEFIEGREIELAVLENSVLGEKPLVSVAGEICVHHADGFYSYTAKYLESDQTELIIPAQLDKLLLEKLQTAAAAAFTRLKCKGMARVDFFVGKDNTIYFNEINTLPGFTTISMYPKLWEFSGLAYPNLLDCLVNLAIEHKRYRDNLATTYL